MNLDEAKRRLQQLDGNSKGHLTSDVHLAVLVVAKAYKNGEVEVEEAGELLSKDPYVAYLLWMTLYKRKNPVLHGRCSEATSEMVQEFPELKRVPGFVYTEHGKQGHWWCVSEDGAILDPTAEQFTLIWEYEPWAPGMEVRVGKCMNCGDEIYRRPMQLGGERECMCSPECEKEFLEYLEGPRDQHTSGA